MLLVHTCIQNSLLTWHVGYLQDDVKVKGNLITLKAWSEEDLIDGVTMLNNLRTQVPEEPIIQEIKCREELLAMSCAQLRKICKQREIKGYSGKNKEMLVSYILE